MTNIAAMRSDTEVGVQREDPIWALTGIEQ